MFDPKKMTFSAFERYVRIVETVRNSNAFLKADDRMQIICDVLDGGENPSIASIEALCQSEADTRLEYNIALATCNRENGF